MVKSLVRLENQYLLQLTEMNYGLRLLRKLMPKPMVDMLSLPEEVVGQL
tara:strand:+ start:665 stop:811 length:147 start_codon:yes stop_codon:yes gene_type:complete